MFIESIKEGFDITHRNWQLILLRAAVMIINLTGLLFFVGIPIVAVIIYMSVDIANLKDMLPEIISENPIELLSKYIGVIILMFTALLLYMTFASVLALYAFGGMLGVLRNAIVNVEYRFSLSSFFFEAKKLFFPLLRLFSIVFLVITGVVIIFVIIAGFAYFILHEFSAEKTTFSVFVVFFFILLFIFLCIVIGLSSLIYAVYSAIALTVGKRGVGESFRITWDFLKSKPSAFFFYIVLFFGFMAVNIILMILGGSFRIIPMVGVFMVIPYQLAVYAVQIYLGVVMWSSLIVYYIKVTKHTEHKATYDI